eukprot:c28282_g1_i1 orf=380-1327(+)
MIKERLRQAISGIAYTRIENRGKLPLFERFLLPILGLGSLVYRFLLFTRCKLYEWNVVSSVRLPVPVLSVGNITWGGNGKTPMVEYLARCILHADMCPLILTRHWRVIRDIEILMVNAVTLFGNGELIPYGPLREPLDALYRADIVVIHNASLVTDQQVELIMHRLKLLLSPDTPVVCSQMVPHFFLRVSSIPLNLKEIISDWLPEQLVELEAIKDATVLCISGIGCPECFFLTIKQDLVKVQRKVNDLHGKRSRTFVVLTEKDYARSWEIFVGLHGVDVLVLHSTLEVMKNSGGLNTFNALISKKLLCWDPLVK